MVFARRVAFRSAAPTLALALCCAACLPPRAARAYTPESPEVEAMIDRAIQFLEKSINEQHTPLGAEALVGIALLKAGREPSHPWVQKALKSCKAAVAGGLIHDSLDSSGSNYSVCLAAIFMCDLDAQAHRADIDKLMAAIYKRQTSYGAWTYSGGGQGDTSQTQYGVLAMWNAKHHKIDVPADAVAKCCNWLIATQDPTGAFGYMGLPGQGGARVNQQEIRISLCAAGLGSLYICGDMLNLSSPRAVKKESTLPPALKVVEEEGKPKPPPAAAIPGDLYRRAIEDGNNWFANNYTISTAANSYDNYYLYALERYRAFRDVAEGKNDPEPFWYNDGVEHLAKTQSGAGSWESAGCGAIADTAFAILFLLRGTQRSLGKVAFSEGLLQGGRGLPPDLSKVRMKDGRVIGAPVARSITELLALLEDPDSGAVDELLEFPELLNVTGDTASDKAQIERWERLVAHPDYEKRMAALHALGRARNLDHAPLMIFALGDPDIRVAYAADRALRYVSRKIDGFPLSRRPTINELRSLKIKWKEWLLSLRPDARFLD